jgi:hypothetical protein
MMLVDQIRSQLADWDREHDTTGCPGGPGCIHTAAAALGAVLDVHTMVIHAPGSVLPAHCRICPDHWDVYPCRTVRAIADALGIAVGAGDVD